MTNKPITQAKDADLRNSQAALIRAAARAREVARRTGTRLVVVREGRIHFIDPTDSSVSERGDYYGRDE